MRYTPEHLEWTRNNVVDRKARGLLPDRFKSPIFAMWEITYACPLRCVHCYNSSGYRPGPTLATDKLLYIADQIGENEVMTVCLTGGEPTLVKGYLAAARRLKEHGVGVGTPTTGFNLSLGLAAEMVGIFDTIQVSVDGATAETHDRIRQYPGSFDIALRALDLFDGEIAKLGSAKTPSLCAAFVVNQMNVQEFEDFIDLVCQRYPHLSEIRSQAIVPTGRARDLGMQLTEEQMIDCENLCCRKAMEYPGVKMEFGDPCGHIQKARVDYPWDLVVIDPQGNVRFSPWLPGHVGNVFQRSLNRIWNEELADLHNRPEIADQLDRINLSNDMQEVGIALEAVFGGFGGGRPNA